jgi:hypothetical protein
MAARASEPTVYPKPAKLPDGPSPYLDAQVVDQAPPPNRLNQEKSEGADAGKVTTDQAAVALEVDYLGPAVWRSQETDRTVIVTGFFGEVDGLPWYRIAGSKTGIPGDQLRRVGPSGLGYKSEGNGAKTYPKNFRSMTQRSTWSPTFRSTLTPGPTGKTPANGMTLLYGKTRRRVFFGSEDREGPSSRKTQTVVESVSPPRPAQEARDDVSAGDEACPYGSGSFADLLGFTVPASTTDAGRWLTAREGHTRRRPLTPSGSPG